MKYLKIAYRLVRLRKGARPPLVPLLDTLDLFLGVVRYAVPHARIQSQKRLKVSGKGKDEVSFQARHQRIIPAAVRRCSVL